MPLHSRVHVTCMSDRYMQVHQGSPQASRRENATEHKVSLVTVFIKTSKPPKLASGVRSQDHGDHGSGCEGASSSRFECCLPDCVPSVKTGPGEGLLCVHSSAGLLNFI